LAGETLSESVSVCFTPGGECTDAIVKEIEQAKQQILVQAYSFTSKEIMVALAKAKSKGSDVRVILDKTNRCDRDNDCENRGIKASQFLSSAGIPILIDQISGIAHNKVIIIDQKVIITGSFNFTQAAQFKNAENLLIIRSSDLATRYCENWYNRAVHSKSYLSP
jgi:phosphatidylserine/phosphatidylglycerophosphate/cardiolipin synthase-like enzyme